MCKLHLNSSDLQHYEISTEKT